MTQSRLVNAAASAIVLACAAGTFTFRVSGQVRAGQPSISSLTEPGDGLTIRNFSPVTGRPTFASTDARGILLAGVAPGAAPEARARMFVQLYGNSFGLGNTSQVALAAPPSVDRVGVEHVRFQQVHQGVPVVAGELIVHMRGSRVVGANGRIVETLPADVTPTVVPGEAQAAARRVLLKIARDRVDEATVTDPKLQILNQGLFDDFDGPSALTWFVEVRAFAIREFVWVDAHTGDVVLYFNQAAEALDRKAYNTNNTTAVPGTLVRSEGQPAVGNADVDNAYLYAGDTYAYLHNSFGLDSFDNAGASLQTTAHYGTNYKDSFWDGTEAVFGDGFASADDIVGHELWHGVTDHTAQFFFHSQSGALSESFSDIHGETIDLTNGHGTDTAGVRWLIGEDITGVGAIRSMSDPTLYGNPGKMSDSAYFVCENDRDGVHTDSGVPNHAYALMVDGGTYNGRTITGIGLTKASQIEYRAEATYLTSGATFYDDFVAVNQSCSDLVGSFGITAGDCTQVQMALDAVELNKPWACAGEVATPPLCPTGAAPVSTAFFDGFESGIGNWTTNDTLAPEVFFWNNQNAATGTHDAVSVDQAHVSDQRFTMAAGVVIPAGGRLYFNQKYVIEDGFDGLVLEYSTNGGTTWNDAGGMIDGGRNYTTTLSGTFGNPLAGRQAWSGYSHGYTGVRLDLSSLAGKTAIFRFRQADDSQLAWGAWAIDNVQIYTCAGTTAGEMTSNGNFGGGTASWVTFPNSTSDMVYNVTSGVFQWYRPAGSSQGVVFQQTGMAIPGPDGSIGNHAPTGGIEAVFDIGNSTTARKRMTVLLYDSDFSDLSVCSFYMDPGAPLATYRMRGHTNKPWTNASIAFYAANTGNEGGGYYRLDNVSMQYRNDGSISSYRTECVDPNVPVAGGITSAELMGNGNFSGGSLTPWFTSGNLSWQVTAGVFEFFKLAGNPAGVLAQYTNTAFANDQRMTATFQLGNSSGVKQRVTVLLGDSNFSDISACTFWVLPGQALNNYLMRTYSTQAWTNATLSIYPATTGTAPTAQWLRLDNVSFTETTTPALGTECYEPGG